MKAYVLHGVNDLRFEEVEKPAPQKGEVLVKVKAVGICGSDIPRIFETGAHKHPLIPGHEFSGIVKSAFDANGEKWLGKRVGVFPLIPCHNCELCQREHFEMCKNYSYIGSRQNGAFAEYVTVPIDNLIELPDNISFETAAMLEPMAVAVHAIRRVNPEITDSVAICGLGTIGTFVAMFLKSMGIRNVFFFGNKKTQIENIQKLGLNDSNFCDDSTMNPVEWLQRKTNGQGTNVFFECVGKNDTVNLAVYGVAPLGRIMLVGNPYSDMRFEKNLYWKILRQQLTVRGTWNSTFTHDDNDDWHYVLRQISNSTALSENIISHFLSLEELPRGLSIMKDKIGNYCKIMIIMA